MASKKTPSRNTSFAVAGSSNGKAGAKWESNQARIFEPTRKKVEYNLDEFVTDALGEYEDYLKEVFGRDPNMNGVVEAILLDALTNHEELRKWQAARVRQQAGQSNGNGTSKSKEAPDSEDNELLEGIGNAAPRVGGNQAAKV